MRSLVSMWLAFAGVALLAFSLTASADDGCGSKKSSKKGCQSCDRGCPCHGDRDAKDDDDEEDDDRGRSHARRGHDDDDDDEDDDRGRSHARRGHDDDEDEDDDRGRRNARRGHDDDEDEDDEEDDDEEDDDEEDDDDEDEDRNVRRSHRDGGNFDWQEHAREMFESFGGRDGDAGRMLERFRDMMEERGGRNGRRGGREDFGNWEELAQRGMEEFQNLPPETRREIEKLLAGNGDGIEGIIERFRGMAEQRGGRRGARRGHEDDDEDESEDEDEGNGDEMNQWRERARDLFEQFQKGDRGGEAGKLLERLRGMMEERRGGRHDEDEEEEEDEDDDTM